MDIFLIQYVAIVIVDYDLFINISTMPLTNICLRLQAVPQLILLQRKIILLVDISLLLIKCKRMHHVLKTYIFFILAVYSQLFHSSANVPPILR